MIYAAIPLLILALYLFYTDFIKYNQDEKNRQKQKRVSQEISYPSAFETKKEESKSNRPHVAASAEEWMREKNWQEFYPDYPMTPYDQTA
jgi:hypothetical protein